ncbi:MAG TPA: hypothetical protein VHL78_04305 [Actinomycetota bacterium]|nr:hypothetical protein [Actinomycetota bacterium]
MILRTVPALLVVALAACGGEPEARPDPSPAPRLAAALDGLCRAVGLASEGDVDGAGRLFQDRTHAYLHELADRGSDAAPEPTGRLLEGKERAEAAFAGPGPSDPVIVQYLVDIDQAAREVARELGMALPPPCRGVVA